MKLTIENTDKLTRVNDLETRVWRGRTEAGVPVTLYVVRIQVEDGKHQEFERELIEQPPRHVEYDPSIPLRLII